MYLPEDGGSASGKGRLKDETVFSRHKPNLALDKKGPEEVRCWNERRKKCHPAVGNTEMGLRPYWTRNYKFGNYRKG